VCTAIHAAKGDLTLDDWRYVAGEFNRIGEKVKAAGHDLRHHNHVPEFAVKMAWLSTTNCSAHRPQAMLSSRWIADGSSRRDNPVDYLSKTPERFRCCM
jgi:hypothetical protein